MCVQALTDLLEAHGVDTSPLGRFACSLPRPSCEIHDIGLMAGRLQRCWGDGKAKPLASLLRELKEGSCNLHLDSKKQLGGRIRCQSDLFLVSVVGWGVANH